MNHDGLIASAGYTVTEYIYQIPFGSHGFILCWCKIEAYDSPDPLAFLCQCSGSLGSQSEHMGQGERTF